MAFSHSLWLAVVAALLTLLNVKVCSGLVGFTLESPWTTHKQGNCKEKSDIISCTTESGGLEACQKLCEDNEECTSLNFIPPGASGESGVNRCCLLSCPHAETVYDSKTKGWDFYEIHRNLVCPVGYNAISQNLDGAGKEWSQPDPEPSRTIQECADICNARSGCTGFEFAEGQSETGACGTYTGGESNIEVDENRLSADSNWRSCLRIDSCVRDPARCTITALGCWNDQYHQTGIPLVGRFQDQGRADPKGDCFKHAVENCFDGFAMQDSGTCRTGPAILSQYDKLGSDTRCSVSNNVLGGPWANNIYRIDCE